MLTTEVPKMVTDVILLPVTPSAFNLLNALT